MTEEGVEESQELRRLEQDVTNTDTVLRFNKEILEKKRGDVKQLHQTLEDLNEKSAQLWDLFSKNLATRDSLEQEDGERLCKLNETESKIMALKSKLEQKRLTHSEKSLELEFLQEANKGALEKLEELCAQYKDIAPTIDKYLTENNLS